MRTESIEENRQKRGIASETLLNIGSREQRGREAERDGNRLCTKGRPLRICVRWLGKGVHTLYDCETVWMFGGNVYEQQVE